jgi:hypothetical protein
MFAHSVYPAKVENRGIKDKSCSGLQHSDSIEQEKNVFK